MTVAPGTARLARRLLLAGSWGPERVPARPDPEQARWFEPLHVRDEGGARERIAAQVAAGADVVVAPTWLTHRRALLSLGETRRARAWTGAAVRIAREAVEVGLERREQADAGATESDGDADIRHSRPAPLVAASLPALDQHPDPDSGHRLPRDAATERDYRDQAGLLADAEPDLLLVEGQAALPALRLAVREAVATGLHSWVALSGVDTDSIAPEPLFELLRETAVRRVLLTPPALRRLPDIDLDWGGLVDPAAATSVEAAQAWLDAGASVIGLLDAAMPGRLEPLRAAIDDRDRAQLEAARQAQERWQAHVGRAAAMAPRGVALWLHAAAREQPLPTSLPDGFEWLILGHERARGLPEDHFRLIIDPIGGPDAAARWGDLLEHGGIVALPLEPSASGVAGLRWLALDDSRDPPLAILRREG